MGAFQRLTQLSRAEEEQKKDHSQGSQSIQPFRPHEWEAPESSATQPGAGPCGGPGGASPGSWRVSRPASEGGLRRGWGPATMAVQVGRGAPRSPHDLTDGYQPPPPAGIRLSALIRAGGFWQPLAWDQGSGHTLVLGIR